MRTALRFVSVFALLAGLLAVGARPAAAVTWWQPTSLTAQSLHWTLDTGAGDPPVDVNNPWHIGERTRAGAVQAPPAVLDVDGDYNTRDADPASFLHVSRGVVETFHARGQKAICYMDAGVQEMDGNQSTFDREPPYRFPVDRHAEVTGWGGYWLDFTEPGAGTTAPDSRVLAVIEKRMVDWCVTGGFDAVELDEVDYWENKGSRGPADVTYASQLAYNRAIYDMAHAHNLAVVHKGDLAQIRDLEPWADATLNEECGRYQECLNEWNPATGLSCTEQYPADAANCGLRLFANHGKAVWVGEYTTGGFNRACTTYQSAARHFNTARYYLGLPAGPPNTSNGGSDRCPGAW